jgi:hypothetical protein
MSHVPNGNASRASRSRRGVLNASIITRCAPY